MNQEELKSEDEGPLIIDLHKNAPNSVNDDHKNKYEE